MLIIFLCFLIGVNLCFFDVYVLGICDLPPETGPCKRNLRQYYFDRASGQCKTFTYGGCLGNANRFQTETECKIKCGGKFNFILSFVTLLNFVFRWRKLYHNIFFTLHNFTGCPQFCTSHYLPVCGTDGKTYGNKCELKKAACKTGNNKLAVAYEGRCQGIAC